MKLNILPELMPSLRALNRVRQEQRVHAGGGVMWLMPCCVNI